jgi:hypothetical protein
VSATSRSTGKACKKRSSFRCAKLRSRRSVLISQSAVYRRIHTTQHKLAQRSAATVSGDVVIDTVAASEHLARRSTGTRLAPRVYSALPALHSAVCDRCSAARESGERSDRHVPSSRDLHGAAGCGRARPGTEPPRNPTTRRNQVYAFHLAAWARESDERVLRCSLSGIMESCYCSRF